MSYSRRQLEALGEPLGDSATRLKEGGFGRIYGGGGGGGGSSSAPAAQTQTQITDVPDWAKPYAQDVLSKGQALTSNTQAPQYTGQVVDPVTGQTSTSGQRIAGFNELQKQSQQGVANLSTGPGFDTGAGFNTAAGLGALQTTGQAGGYGLQGAMAGMQGMRAGMGYGQQATNPYAVQAYMNPYLQAALAPQIELANRQYGQQAAQMAGQATQAGAFGGSRFGIQQAQNDLNRNLALQNLVGQGYNQAFNTAQQNMQQAAQLGMQGAGMGIQGAQAGLAGVNAQLQGYQAAGAAGVNASNIANQKLQAQQGILGLQSQTGAQQQALSQQALDTSYQNFLNQMNYPYQQLSYMANLVRGTPMGMSTQSQVYQNPSTVSQLAGLGTAAAGAYGLSRMKKGGKVKTKTAKKPGGGLMELAISKMA